MLVAGRYLPQQYLIGPAVFPIYWFTLKTVMWVALVVAIVAACMTPLVADIVASAGDPRVPSVLRSPGALIWGGVLGLLAVGGAVTLLFALIERFPGRVRLLEHWSPRNQLRSLPKPPWGMEGRPIPRAQSLALLAMSAVALVFLALSGGSIPEASSSVLQPTPAWQTFRWWLMLLPVMGMAEACLDLSRLQRTWTQTLLQVVRAAVVVVLLVLARSGNLVEAVNGGTMNPDDAARVASIVNSAVFYGVLLGFCFGALGFAVTLVRYLGRRMVTFRSLAASGVL